MGGRSKLDWSFCSDVWFFFPGCNGDINKLEENKQIRSLVCLERSRLNLKSCSRFPLVCPTGISRFANSSWMWNTNCLICSSNWDELKIFMCLKGTSKHFCYPMCEAVWNNDWNLASCRIANTGRLETVKIEVYLTLLLPESIYGCFLKWWYPQNTPKWSFLVGKPMVVGYHHFRKPPYVPFAKRMVLSLAWCVPILSLHLNMNPQAHTPGGIQNPPAKHSKMFLIENPKDFQQSFHKI